MAPTVSSPTVSGYWYIENRLHCVRDVVLGEDGCRAKVGPLPQNLAAFRNLGIWLLRRLNSKGIASTLRNSTKHPARQLT